MRQHARVPPANVVLFKESSPSSPRTHILYSGRAAAARVLPDGVLARSESEIIPCTICAAQCIHTSTHSRTRTAHTTHTHMDTMAKRTRNTFPFARQSFHRRWRLARVKLLALHLIPGVSLLFRSCVRSLVLFIFSRVIACVRVYCLLVDVAAHVFFSQRRLLRPSHARNDRRTYGFPGSRALNNCGQSVGGKVVRYSLISLLSVADLKKTRDVHNKLHAHTQKIPACVKF